MATDMQLGIMSVDNLVLCSNNQDRNVSVKSVTMRGTSFEVVLQIYGVFYRDPEIGFKLFFLTDSCSRDLALQESD